MMTPRKMLPFTAGALLLLLPWFGGLTSGELSDKKFTMCQKFFYKRTPPRGFGTGHKAICQRYKNKYRFATLYDRQKRTALFSAYLMSSSNEPRPDGTWMYEPQLVSKTADPEMKPFPNPVGQNMKNSQAVPEDYTNNNYTKGHLAPSQHLNTEDDRTSSFTLTNIVPQKAESNNGPWSDLETEVLRRFNTYCNGQMYVLTGTIPYKSKCLLKGRVSIPEYIWSAYCCPSFKSDLPNDTRIFFPTHGAWGRNGPCPDNNTVEENPSPYAVRRVSLPRLQRFLRERLGMTGSLFSGDCQSPKP
ncbi:endonuclease domain-containing 1 protein-like [Mugil cephalus]|uniref:endonuclease domain-containing 1 protein-like n=1 Tax=Mugil cephalus TaxID=48193 RepID=UPI001FB5936C|nr:endonuclease domain-containing 1 protein-like [Mugil cephalus]